jgi:hypothetical protein
MNASVDRPAPASLVTIRYIGHFTKAAALYVVPFLHLRALLAH